MPGRDEYQGKAETCVAQAKIIRDPQERAAILSIAQLYMKLSERVTTHRRDRVQLFANDG
jgi:hypothetical protein